EEIVRLNNLIELGKQKLALQTEVKKKNNNNNLFFLSCRWHIPLSIKRESSQRNMCHIDTHIHIHAYTHMSHIINQIEQLSRENKSLHDDIHQLYSTLKDKGLAKPYRMNTMTNWKEEDLEELEAEMSRKGAELRKEDLKRQFERQEEMYWQSQGIPEDAETQNNDSKNDNVPNAYRAQTIIHHGDEDEPAKEATDNREHDAEDEAAKKSHIIRSATETGFWTENDWQAVKDDMMTEIKKIKNQQIAQMVEKQDALRMQKTNPSEIGDTQELEEFSPVKEATSTIAPNNNTESAPADDQVGQLRNEIMAEMHRLHLQSMQEMFEREEKLRWNPQNEKHNLMTEETANATKANDLEKMQEEMMGQLREMTRQELTNMFEKQFRLRENQPINSADGYSPNASVNTNINANVNVNANANNSGGNRSGPHNLVHPKTSLADDELEKLRQEMLEDLNSKQRVGLTAMFEQQTKNLWTGYESSPANADTTNKIESNTDKEKGKEKETTPKIDQQLNEKKGIGR
ncbi:hypothetical protein RFI_08827, partial [Reticulomyxa filosa]